MRIAVLALATMMWSVHAWAADPKTDLFVGTWKMNEQKSVVSSGQVPKNRTITYAPMATGLLVTMQGDGINGSDKVNPIPDGKERPAESSQLVRNTGADVAAVKPLNSHTFLTTIKKDGKIVGTLRREVSKDGRTLTTTGDGVTLKGEKMHNVFVYDKQ